MLHPPWYYAQVPEPQSPEKRVHFAQRRVLLERAWEGGRIACGQMVVHTLAEWYLIKETDTHPSPLSQYYSYHHVISWLLLVMC